MTPKPQRPARPADLEGTVERKGVTIAYRVYDDPAAMRGNGGVVEASDTPPPDAAAPATAVSHAAASPAAASDPAAASHAVVRPTVVLLPTWSIVPSRIWKAQVPYLAKHFRVVTFDGRGSGLSTAPTGAPAYADNEYVADALAVLAATGTGTCVLVSFSRGVPWALQLAQQLPDQVRGVVCIGSAAGLVPAQEERIRWSWEARHETTDGWAKYNRHYWTEGDYDDFLRFFFTEMFPEPHSSKQIEDAIGWGHEISPERLVDTEAARQNRNPDDLRVNCPVLIVHGSDDKIRPHAEGVALAELTGGSLITVAGGGHAPNARDPVLVNRLLKDFVDQVAPQPVRRTWTRAANRPNGSSTSRPRSVSAMPAGTSRSPANSDRTTSRCRSTGSPSTRSRESSPMRARRCTQPRRTC